MWGSKQGTETGVEAEGGTAAINMSQAGALPSGVDSETGDQLCNTKKRT